MSFLQKLFGRYQHDEADCIRILFDRTQRLHDRAVAAEYLYKGQTPTATAALLRFVLDDTQEVELREEAAGTLGDIYSVVGIDRQAVEKLPKPFRDEILAKTIKKGT